MIENPMKRKNCNMSTWYRITEDDGSTIAYCPDVVTAKLVDTAPDLLEACEKLLDMITDSRLHGDEVDFAADVIYKAKGENL